MIKSQEKLLKEVAKLPDTPGVYKFLGKEKQILYIGKATSLRSRVKSYFSGDLVQKRSALIEKMMFEASSIQFEKTDSVLEALLLESDLIKKHLPPYNTADKDQKSFNYVVITKESFPRVLLMREREITSPPLLTEAVHSLDFSSKNLNESCEASSIRFSPPSLKRRGGNEDYLIDEAFGPFPHARELKEALKIVRKIFPFRDKCQLPHPQPLSLKRRGEKEGPVPRPVRRSLDEVGSLSAAKSEVGCFNYQIGLCPGVCAGVISEKEYAKTIRHIKTFFQGKKKKLIKDLEVEMKVLAKQREFEKAAEIKSKVFALQHINDIALIRKESPFVGSFGSDSQAFRIEAYDIAHIAGTNMVGVMTVLEDGEAKKSDYRMFKIRSQKGSNDVGALKEVLERRFKHTEWRFPNLVVMDGGVAQLNIGEEVLKNLNLNIPVVAVTKDERHKAKKIIGASREALTYEKYILLSNSEAHRFAISFHRRLRDSIKKF